MKRKSVISLLTILLVCFSATSCNSTKFDSNEWKHWKETEETASLRWDMTKDLVKTHKLIDSSVSEIISLLGEPSHKTDKELRYYLGMSGHGIDTGSLILKIQNGKVVDYKIWHG
jgi:hypothetical protein